MQAIVRLIQTLHMLCDTIMDWDTIFDSFGQLLTILNSKPSSPPEDLVLLDIEKLSSALERFKSYTMFMSNDALIKLMSSLVALSSNGLEDIPHKFTQSSPTHFKVKSVQPNTPTYFADAVQNGLISYPLRLVIEITKMNSYRVFCIW